MHAFRTALVAAAAVGLSVAAPAAPAEAVPSDCYARITYSQGPGQGLPDGAYSYCSGGYGLHRVRADCVSHIAFGRWTVPGARSSISCGSVRSRRYELSN